VTRDTSSSLVEPTNAVSPSNHLTQLAQKLLPDHLQDLPQDLPQDHPQDLLQDQAHRPTTVILFLDLARATKSTSPSPVSLELSAHQNALDSSSRPNAHPTFLRESPQPQLALLRTPAPMRSTALLSAPRIFTSPRLKMLSAEKLPARPSLTLVSVSAHTITKLVFVHYLISWRSSR